MQNCRLFSGLSDRQIKLAKQQLDGVINSYREAEVIVEEDAIVNRIGILLQGNAYISKFTMDGKELLMQKLVPFYLVCAEVAFTRKQNAPYTIYCEKDTDIYWFSIEKITKNGLIDDGIREILLRNIMLYIADENMRKYHKIEAISIKGIRERIVHYLALQQKINGSNQFYIKFDREKLANFLGMNRSVLSHELKRMEKEGLITFKKNYFEIFRL
ncbi:MAG TPA: Crp/Fnr family transcriptional regulator [Bacillota bacterium]|nr:Crp/Fnr family transcriptional regulator [Clostridiales bacterium]HNR03535.1 Crp/Fnr family transcriptional regulator [Bacillota bacterium]HNT02699.1 Crp/Fnr family transcriptional regulator [Bacillota bacterium]HPX68036.1 Crp/Fnr family transcriptional regulator [Bacillota bacterium]HQA64415.1 Crp/Fnr family transcriptional regulator [Bacillota bacterium]